jgi:glycerol uptake facilitator protein
MSRPPKWIVGEFCGTFLLVFFGCGSVCAAVTTSAQVGIFQVAIVWGLGIATAIYLTGALSGAHLNPAVTLAMAAWNGFSWRRVLPYLGAQWLGAFVASAVLYVLFGGALRLYEESNGVVRGAPGSEASAMVFAEYYPNPGGKALTPHAREGMSDAGAFGAELAATAILVLVILCCVDERNAARPQILTAAAIGLTVTLLISVVGPLTMGCFNPARDLAPRVFSALAGWGGLPFSVNGWGWLTVYVLAPLCGGLLGGGIYAFIFKKAYENKRGP